MCLLVFPCRNMYYVCINFMYMYFVRQCFRASVNSQGWFWYHRLHCENIIAACSSTSFYFCSTREGNGSLRSAILRIAIYIYRFLIFDEDRFQRTRSGPPRCRSCLRTKIRTCGMHVHQRCDDNNDTMRSPRG